VASAPRLRGATGVSYQIQDSAPYLTVLKQIAVTPPDQTQRVTITVAAWASWADPAASATTLNGKFVVGYQGWFSSPGDHDYYSKTTGNWSHWSKNGTGVPTFTNITFEMWPDMSEYSQLYDTGFNYQSPATISYVAPANAQVFSAYDPSTVLKHFQWMQQYGIDGAVIQRFTVSQQVTDNYETREALHRLAAMTDTVRSEQ
jgi:hypothetical protein